MTTGPGGLGIAVEALVGLSAAIASRDPAELERSLRLADRVADADAVDEVILQSHLFVGFPVALEALVSWRSILPREDAVDADPAPAAEWPARGAEVCEVVYGKNYAKLRANVESLHPAFDRWMVEGGYGRVIGRPGLDLVTRELCVAALLVVWAAPRQLHSHLRGALNAGAREDQVERAIEIAGRLLSPDELVEIHALWDRITGRTSCVR